MKLTAAWFFLWWLARLSRADEGPTHTYLGCYSDKTKKRDLEERVDGTIVSDISAVSNGPRWCAEVCHSLGFPYFGLQTLICFCGSAYGSYGAAKDSASARGLTRADETKDGEIDVDARVRQGARRHGASLREANALRGRD